MHSVVYGDKEILFELRVTNRKTLGITVYPDLSVVVSAPENAPDYKIKEKVKSKARWIMKQQRGFEKYQPLSKPKEFVSGETHLYLGKEYILKVVRSGNGKVKLRGRYFFVETARTENAEKLMEEWYRAKASIHFSSIIEDLIPLFEKHDIKVNDLIIRKMNTRWGSCTPGGTITLNLHLIKAPRRCIEYVILHELCHLVYHKHDSRFYQLLNSMMPNWEKWKERLEVTLA